MAKKAKKINAKRVAKMFGGKKKLRKAFSNFFNPDHFKTSAKGMGAGAGLGLLSEAMTDPEKLWDRLKSDGTLLLELLQDWAKGEYTDVSRKSMIVVAGSIAYFLSPIDVIPDWIPGAGQIDDALVALFAFSTIADEIEKYRSWKGEPRADQDEETKQTTAKREPKRLTPRAA
jgi:uncharacterized membrane protein YkvA (DUF1232 family)